jgi:membrane protein DedA with SNARE-associated domain/rhodanese-related sulfurtransferase
MDITPFFAEYGPVLVFGVVLVERLGVPVPAMPVLLFAGAKAVEDPLYGVIALALAILACMTGDLVWYAAGRRYGHGVLKLLCRMALSPDSCVRQTEDVFEKRGVATLVIAKFVPGLATVAPPVAGALGLKASSFLIFNGAGSALYSGTGIVLGLLFHDQVDWLLERFATLGARAMAILGVLLALYVAYRWWERHRCIKSLDAGRISVDELSRMINAGEEPIVLDVRSRAHRKLDGRRIPGAVHVDLDALDATLEGIPRDRDVVVYCACPNEVTAVKVAMQLRDRGIRKVRPLRGGVDAWVLAGFEVEGI